MVDKVLGDYDFEMVRGAMPGIPVKSAPAAALRIAEQMKMPPARFVYVGGGNTDMQTAGAAGMYAVGALWGFRTADELTQAGAKILIEKPREVVTLFGADD
jgi:phosphoglycolate phosphatase